MGQQNVIGVSVTASNAQVALDRIKHLDELGIGCAWLTSSGGGGEAVTVLAAAAAVTDEIKLGTSIVQTWSRHPVTLVQQVQVIDSLAPGRFRLGVGPSHRAGMISTFGVDFRAPIGHLREYLQILRSLMHTARSNSKDAGTQPTPQLQTPSMSPSWLRRFVQERLRRAARCRTAL